MHRLSRRDLGAALDCLRMTYATLDHEAFPRQAVAGLLRVVPALFGSHNEIDRGADQVCRGVGRGSGPASRAERRAVSARAACARPLTTEGRRLTTQAVRIPDSTAAASPEDL
jgi:hypothetical protein